MSDFSNFKEFVLPKERESSDEIFANYRHHLFQIKAEEVHAVHYALEIPLELKEFYLSVGYGFFYQKDKSSFDRLLGVHSFKQINLREDFYEYDPDLELYDEEEYRDKLIFFEVNEGVYLLIDKKEKDGKNAIYYFDRKIANSLEDFLIRFDAEGHYFEE